MSEGAFYWFGPPRVEIGGRAVQLETRKTTALLVLLSVEGKPFSRESLAAMFWPEYDPRRAPANLRRVLSSLQKSLGSKQLRIDRETVEYCGGQEIKIDYLEFINEIHRIDAACDDTAPELQAHEAEKLKQALSLYTGEFLEGFNLKDSPGFDQWQMQIRQKAAEQAGRA